MTRIFEIRWREKATVLGLEMLGLSWSGNYIQVEALRLTPTDSVVATRCSLSGEIEPYEDARYWDCVWALGDPGDQGQGSWCWGSGHGKPKSKTSCGPATTLLRGTSWGVPGAQLEIGRKMYAVGSRLRGNRVPCGGSSSVRAADRPLFRPRLGKGSLCWVGFLGASGVLAGVDVGPVIVPGV